MTAVQRIQVNKERKCSCLGSTLDKLIQPSILIIIERLGECHGYVILQELEKVERDGIDKAGTYRTLKLMEERGLIKSRWSGEGGDPPKKIFSMAEEGYLCLQNWVETLEQYQAKLNSIINEAQRVLKNKI